jgi:hypothetical protein
VSDISKKNIKFKEKFVRKTAFIAQIASSCSSGMQYASGLNDRSDLPVTDRRSSLMNVKKVLLALLVTVLGLHGSVVCGIAQAETSFMAPCCGQSCPVSSAAGERTCCQNRTGTSPAVISGKFNLASPQIASGMVQTFLQLRKPTFIGFQRALVFPASPPGTGKLALLCSLQI